MRVVVHRAPTPPVEARRVEIVERKGLGHPDSICDGLPPMPEPDAQREPMVRTPLAARGIRDAAGLDAFRAVPREAFLPPEQAADRRCRGTRAGAGHPFAT